MTDADVGDVRQVGARGDDSSTLAYVRQRRAFSDRGYPSGGLRKPALVTGVGALAAVTALGVWLRQARLEPVRVAGSSMAPTLPAGTLVAAGPVRRPLRRGQLVLVHRRSQAGSPAGAAAPLPGPFAHAPEAPGAPGRPGPPAQPVRPMELVKRIVGLPGEHVRLTGSRLEVDGRLVPEPYLAAGPRDARPFETRLGPGEYLVLGDRRAESTDSRSFGPIGRHDVIGIVRFVYWPPAAWRTTRAIKRLGISTVSPGAEGQSVTGIDRRLPK